jgi:hypothetical protein
MRAKPILLVTASGLLLVGAAVAVRAFQTPQVSFARHPAADLSPALEPAVPLAFAELLDPGPALRPSAKALALDGKRVRIVGFMADMEEPMAGAFYLVPRPIKLDESGAGTGDLPLESLLVEVVQAEGRVLPHADGALEGTGVLEVGNRADDHGRSSNFRLRLDPDQRLAHAAKAAPSTTAFTKKGS